MTLASGPAGAGGAGSQPLGPVYKTEEEANERAAREAARVRNWVRFEVFDPKGNFLRGFIGGELLEGRTEPPNHYDFCATCGKDLFRASLSAPWKHASGKEDHPPVPHGHRDGEPMMSSEEASRSSEEIALHAHLGRTLGKDKWRPVARIIASHLAALPVSAARALVNKQLDTGDAFNLSTGEPLRTGNPTPSRLDAFTGAYFDAAFWSTTDEDGDPLDQNFTTNDLARGTREQMIADAERFQQENAVDIEEARETIDARRGRGNTDVLAGHDFWLTRNGHGAGFWDGDWPEPQATRLTDAAHAFGEVDLYVGDDGEIYASGSESPREANPAKRSKGKKKKRSANPLTKGSTRAIVSGNISKMVKEGYPQDQAIAASLSYARRHPTKGHPVPRRPNPADYVVKVTTKTKTKTKVKVVPKANPATQALPAELRARLRDWQGKTGPTRALVKHKKLTQAHVRAALAELRKIHPKTVGDRAHLAKTIAELATMSTS